MPTGRAAAALAALGLLLLAVAAVFYTAQLVAPEETIVLSGATDRSPAAVDITAAAAAAMDFRPADAAAAAGIYSDTAAASRRRSRKRSRRRGRRRRKHPGSGHLLEPPRAPPSGYLMVFGAYEGFSGWLVVLEEAAALAVALNRVLVLPCVRAGKLRPCSPWAPIRGPPALVEHGGGGATAAWEALARQGAAGLPAVAWDCTTGNGSALLSAGAWGDAFSLDAYFSPAGIASILARGLARLRQVRGVPLPARPPGTSDDDGYYRVHTVTFSQWYRNTYGAMRPGSLNRLHARLRTLHFEAPALDLTPNADCQRDATNRRYTVHREFTFTGKVCLGDPGDGVVSGLGYDLGVLATRRWQSRPLVAVVRWQRERLADMAAAVPFPQPHAVHFVLVRAWLRRHALSTAHLDRAAAAFDAAAAAAASARQLRAASVGSAHYGGAPLQARSSGRRSAGGAGFTVAHWRTERLSDAAFDSCAQLVTAAVGALTTAPARARLARDDVGSNGTSSGVGDDDDDDDDDHHQRLRNATAANRTRRQRGRPATPPASSPPPLVLLTDLPSAGNPCATSFSYDRTVAQMRSAHTPLLRDPRVLKYDRDLLAAGQLFDAGVVALHEYLIALSATAYSTCNRRGQPPRHARKHPQCHACFWPSEFITRIVRARAQLALPTDESFLDGL